MSLFQSTSATTTRSLLLSSCLMLGAAASSAAHADYPDRVVHVVVASTAGGALDTFSRMVSSKLSERMGQPFVVENRPGVGGNIGTAAVARSAADGYTLLFAIDTTFTVNPSVYDKLPFDPEKDFATISVPVTYGQMLAVGPDVPAKTLLELLALAKTKPLNYGSGGVGSPSHLTFASLIAATGVPFAHVPYKASGPAVVDAMGGQVEAVFAVTQAVLPQVKAGKLRALAVSSSTRSALAPEVPTVAESGFPGFKAEFAYAIMAPKGTPPAVVERLQKEVIAVLNLPSIKTQNVEWDYTPTGMTPEQSAQWLRDTRAQWAKVITGAGVKMVN